MTDLRGDLGHPVKAAEAALIAQVATLVLQREAIAAALVRGSKIDSKELVLITGTIFRSLAALGLHNRGRRRKPDQLDPDSSVNHEDPPRLTGAEVFEGYERLRKSAERNPSNHDVQVRFKGVKELFATAERRMRRKEKWKSKKESLAGQQALHSA